MTRILVLLILVLPCIVLAGQKADFVLVKKNESKLYLMKNGKVFKEFKAAFGPNPKGHKFRRGDGRTPEGEYTLDYKKDDSDFYKAIHVSYPNEKDRKRAKYLEVNPGGQIMIHGLPNGRGYMSVASQSINWTDGCIGVTNSAMDEIWEAVDPDTPIKITP
ncbi:MAG: L,D-transpeptidase family protein [Desulfosalsimonas sp.]